MVSPRCKKSSWGHAMDVRKACVAGTKVLQYPKPQGSVGLPRCASLHSLGSPRSPPSATLCSFRSLRNALHLPQSRKESISHPLASPNTLPKNILYPGLNPQTFPHNSEVCSLRCAAHSISEPFGAAPLRLTAPTCVLINTPHRHTPLLHNIHHGIPLFSIICPIA